MTSITNNQIELLRTAAADSGAIDAPDDAKMIRSLVKQGLLIPLPQAEGPSRLLITEAGREAAAAPDAAPKTRSVASSPRDPAAPLTPKGKLGVLVALLRDPDGATVEAMSAATGWQAHSVRGAMSGGLKKKLGFSITSEKTDGARAYRIVEGPAA